MPEIGEAAEGGVGVLEVGEALAFGNARDFPVRVGSGEVRERSEIDVAILVRDD